MNKHDFDYIKNCLFDEFTSYYDLDADDNDTFLADEWIVKFIRKEKLTLNYMYEYKKVKKNGYEILFHNHINNFPKFLYENELSMIRYGRLNNEYYVDYITKIQLDNTTYYMLISFNRDKYEIDELDVKYSTSYKKIYNEFIQFL